MTGQNTYGPGYTCPDCGQQAASPNAHRCLRDVVLGGSWECSRCGQTHRTSSIHCGEIDLSAVDVSSLWSSRNHSAKSLVVGKTEWLNVVSKWYGLAEGEAEMRLEEAQKQKVNRLLYEYNPKTGFSKDIVRIYLIGDFE